MQEIVISLVAAVARKFMHDCHPDLYLGSKRVTILVSAKQLLDIYAITSVLKP
jgi:hypothetical protein